MKFYAASVPRSVRTSRLSHLRSDVIVGSWNVQNPNGSYQTFDVIMQQEADFVKTKSQLAAPPATTSLATQGQPPTAYVLRDIRQVDVPEDDANPAQTAAEHFRKEFKAS